jgi:hypothetical protein
LTCARFSTHTHLTHTHAKHHTKFAIFLNVCRPKMTQNSFVRVIAIVKLVFSFSGWLQTTSAASPALLIRSEKTRLHRPKVSLASLTLSVYPFLHSKKESIRRSSSYGIADVLHKNLHFVPLYFCFQLVCNYNISFLCHFCRSFVNNSQHQSM